MVKWCEGDVLQLNYFLQLNNIFKSSGEQRIVGDPNKGDKDYGRTNKRIFKTKRQDLVFK